MARMIIGGTLLVSLCGVVHGRTVTVDAGGGGDHADIQSAIHAAQDGDTVLVRAGEYLGSINFLGKAITVLGEAGPERTVLRAPEQPLGYPPSAVAFYSQETGDSVLEGFTVILESRIRETRALSCNGNASPTIVNCVIQGGHSGLACSEDARPRLEGCQIRGFRMGVQVSGGSQPMLSSCTLIGGLASGPHDDDSSALRSSGESQAHLAHCTLTGGSRGIRSSEESRVSLANCIVWGNPAGAVLTSGTSELEATFSCLEGPEVWPGAENITEDPFFCAPGHWDENDTPADAGDDRWIDGDYRLAPGSPCIDTASDGTNRGALQEECETAPSLFQRGDADGDGSLQLNDPILVLNHLFRGGPAPGCLDAADLDDTGKLELTDSVYSLSFQFLGGAPPASPFPDCGTDPGLDDLGCDSSACR